MAKPRKPLNPDMSAEDAAIIRGLIGNYQKPGDTSAADRAAKRRESREAQRSIQEIKKQRNAGDTPEQKKGGKKVGDAALRVPVGESFVDPVTVGKINEVLQKGVYGGVDSRGKKYRVDQRRGYYGDLKAVNEDGTVTTTKPLRNVSMTKVSGADVDSKGNITPDEYIHEVGPEGTQDHFQEMISHHNNLTRLINVYRHHSTPDYKGHFINLESRLADSMSDLSSAQGAHNEGKFFPGVETAQDKPGLRDGYTENSGYWVSGKDAEGKSIERTGASFGDKGENVPTSSAEFMQRSAKTMGEVSDTLAALTRHVSTTPSINNPGVTPNTPVYSGTDSTGKKFADQVNETAKSYADALGDPKFNYEGERRSLFPGNAARFADRPGEARQTERLYPGALAPGRAKDHVAKLHQQYTEDVINSGRPQRYEWSTAGGPNFGPQMESGDFYKNPVGRRKGGIAQGPLTRQGNYFSKDDRELTTTEKQALRPGAGFEPLRPRSFGEPADNVPSPLKFTPTPAVSYAEQVVPTRSEARGATGVRNPYQQASDRVGRLQGVATAMTRENERAANVEAVAKLPTESRDAYTAARTRLTRLTGTRTVSTAFMKPQEISQAPQGPLFENPAFSKTEPKKNKTQQQYLFTKNTEGPRPTVRPSVKSAPGQIRDTRPEGMPLKEGRADIFTNATIPGQTAGEEADSMARAAAVHHWRTTTGNTGASAQEINRSPAAKNPAKYLGSQGLEAPKTYAEFTKFKRKVAPPA